jgi:glycosyltransferase involved in cell wall biosynthesis
MDLSVVVPTLNGRDRLAASLDALASHAPDAEVVVVNGPSADGTTGMVRARDDVDVLVEVSARTLNVARNAGVEVASGEAVALVRYDLAVGSEWADELRGGLREAAVVTGPTAGRGPNGPERRRVGGHEVTYFDGSNVAFRAEVLDALDGFDEYLETGGARDAAHRLAALGHDVRWRPGMRVAAEYGSDGGTEPRHPYWKYRALAYRLVKNYGLRPGVLRRVSAHVVGEGVESTREVVRGTLAPTRWLGGGRDAIAGTATGLSDGLVARARDRSAARNPHGISTRADRAVACYDRRDRDGGQGPGPSA